MEQLEKAGLAVVSQSAQSLSYRLLQPGMLSSTGYRVLQSQKSDSFISCFRVIHNGQDKFVYDVENLNILSGVLPNMQSYTFLCVVKSALQALLDMRNIGFLQESNVETAMNKLYVDMNTCSARLVYLPVSEAYVAYMNQGYGRLLVSGLQWAFQSYPSLYSEAAGPLYALLSYPEITLEQLYFSLNAVEFVSPANRVAAHVTDGISGAFTGSMASSAGEFATSGVEIGDSGTLAIQEADEAAKKHNKKEKKIGLFGKSEKRKAAVNHEGENDGTEVLDDIFVPSIALSGTHNSVEFLVDKQDYVLGKKQEAVDGFIDFSAAVSRRHCKVTFSNGNNFIFDLGSANGTFVNGKKLEQNVATPIKEGDKIKLANVTFIVKAV